MPLPTKIQTSPVEKQFTALGKSFWFPLLKKYNPQEFRSAKGTGLVQLPHVMVGGRTPLPGWWFEAVASLKGDVHLSFDAKKSPGGLGPSVKVRKSELKGDFKGAIRRGVDKLLKQVARWGKYTALAPFREAVSMTISDLLQDLNEDLQQERVDVDANLKKGRSLLWKQYPKLYKAGKFKTAAKVAKTALDLFSVTGSHTDAREARSYLKDAQRKAKTESAFFPGETLEEARDHKTVLVRDMRLKDGAAIKAGTKVKVSFSDRADQAKQAFFTLPGERKPKGVPSQKLHQYFRGFTKPPSMSEVNKWLKDGMSKSLTGAVIKGDKAFHKSGVPSWLLVLGYL
jgi:hypothetical protein